jgi:DNA-binding NarL/FixJ family response regulator
MNTLQTSILNLLPADTSKGVKQLFLEACWLVHQEQRNAVEWDRLVGNAQSVSEELQEAFPLMHPRYLVVLHKWALGATAGAIAEATGLSERQVGRILTKARTHNPIVYGRIEHFRTQKAKVDVRGSDTHQSL